MKGMNNFDDIVICGSSGAMGKVINTIISTRNDSKLVAGIDKYGVRYNGFSSGGNSKPTLFSFH